MPKLFPMRFIYIFVSLLLVHITATAQDQDASDSLLNDIPPYNYKTTLKGGYSIGFKANDSLEYLYLKKQASIKAISACSRGTRYKSLGYVGADFENYFVLVHSFGSGNPNYIEIIKKSTGNVAARGAWIDADEQKQMLLYSEADIPDKGDSMILLNVKTNKAIKLQFPDELFDGPEKLNRLRIKKLTSNKLTIVYNTYEERNKDIIKEYELK